MTSERSSLQDTKPTSLPALIPRRARERYSCTTVLSAPSTKEVERFAWGSSCQRCTSESTIEGDEIPGRGQATPNENPFIESAFSTAKRAPEYPGQFRDDAQAVTYFEGYFDWYNHDHSAIDYVTPHQAHEGPVQRRLDFEFSASGAEPRISSKKTTNEKARKLNPSAAILVV